MGSPGPVYCMASQPSKHNAGWVQAQDSLAALEAQLRDQTSLVAAAASKRQELEAQVQDLAAERDELLMKMQVGML